MSDNIKVKCITGECEFIGSRSYKYLICPECHSKEGFHFTELNGEDINL